MSKKDFLHNHTYAKNFKGFDKDHVIVDREDWVQAKEIISIVLKKLKFGNIKNLNVDDFILHLNSTKLVNNSRLDRLIGFILGVISVSIILFIKSYAQG